MPDRSHLARRPRQRHHDSAVRPLDPPGRRRSVVVRQGCRRRDEPGLLEVHLGEWHSSARPEAPQPDLEGRVDRRLLAGHRGDRFPGQVVRRRPETARRDDEVGPLEDPGEGRRHDAQVVRDGLDPADSYPDVGQAPGQLPGVRVTRLADSELRADAEQLGGQDSARTSHGRSVPQRFTESRSPVQQLRATSQRSRRGTIGGTDRRPLRRAGRPSCNRISRQRRLTATVSSAEMTG